MKKMNKTRSHKNYSSNTKRKKAEAKFSYATAKISAIKVTMMRAPFKFLNYSESQ